MPQQPRRNKSTSQSTGVSSADRYCQITIASQLSYLVDLLLPPQYITRLLDGCPIDLPILSIHDKLTMHRDSPTNRTPALAAMNGSLAASTSGADGGIVSRISLFSRISASGSSRSSIALCHSRPRTPYRYRVSRSTAAAFFPFGSLGQSEAAPKPPPKRKSPRRPVRSTLAVSDSDGARVDFFFFLGRLFFSGSGYLAYQHSPAQVLFPLYHVIVVDKLSSPSIVFIVPASRYYHLISIPL